MSMPLHFLVKYQTIKKAPLKMRSACKTRGTVLYLITGMYPSAPPSGPEQSGAPFWSAPLCFYQLILLCRGTRHRPVQRQELENLDNLV